MKDVQDPRFDEPQQVGKAVRLSDPGVGSPGGAGGPYAPHSATAAPGCVCPPGANLECQNPRCPRKAPDQGRAKAFAPGAGGDLMMKGGR